MNNPMTHDVSPRRTSSWSGPERRFLRRNYSSGRSSNGQSSSSYASSSSSSSRSSIASPGPEPPLAEALDSLAIVAPSRRFSLQIKRREVPSKLKHSLAILATMLLVGATMVTSPMVADSSTQGSFPNIVASLHSDRSSNDNGEVVTSQPQPTQKQQLRRSVSETIPLKRGSVEGITYYSQMPSSKTSVKAILFLAHGCGGAASLYWPKSRVCRDCVGAAEHRAIVELARQRGMLVVAASSWDRDTQCWRNRDGPRVAKVLDLVQKNLQKETGQSHHVPVFAFGSSSGGELAGWYLPGTYRKDRLQSEKDGETEVATPMDEDRNRLDGYIMMNKVPRENYDKEIPAVFIKLPNDAETAKSIDAFVKNERQKGALTKQINLPSVPITERLFSDRIPDMTYQQSRTIYQEMLNATLLTSSDSKSKGSVRLKDAPSKLSGTIGSLLSQKCGVKDHRDVFDVLHVAWGHHATTRDGVEEALDWLLDNATGHNQVGETVKAAEKTTLTPPQRAKGTEESRV